MWDLRNASGVQLESRGCRTLRLGYDHARRYVVPLGELVLTGQTLRGANRDDAVRKPVVDPVISPA